MTEKYLKKNFSINFHNKRKGEMNITYGSNKKLLKKINYKKFVSIEIGLKKTIDWYYRFSNKKIFEIYK